MPKYHEPYRTEEVAEKIKIAYNEMNKPFKIKNYIEFIRGKDFPSMTTIYNHFNSWNNCKKKVLGSNAKIYEKGLSIWEEVSDEKLLQKIKEVSKKVDKMTLANYNDFVKGNENYPSSKIICLRLGKWNDIKRKIGLEVYRSDRFKGTKEDVIEMLKEAGDTSKTTFKDVSDYFGGEFPSMSYINTNFGSWSEIKRIVFGGDKRKVKPQFCKECLAERCRFDYNLDECEYYEGR